MKIWIITFFFFESTYKREFDWNKLRTIFFISVFKVQTMSCTFSIQWSYNYTSSKTLVGFCPVLNPNYVPKNNITVKLCNDGEINIMPQIIFPMPHAWLLKMWLNIKYRYLIPWFNLLLSHPRLLDFQQT